MRGNSQNGGQTTKSLLTKPQCSGVPIQQAVSLSSSFPRHCLLFVCAFFCEMQESARSEEQSLPPPPAYKTAPASCYGNRGGSFALWVLFQALAQNLARGLLVSPAYAGKKVHHDTRTSRCKDHPRVCGEKVVYSVCKEIAPGSPPRMRGKGNHERVTSISSGITPAYAGKRPPLPDIAAQTQDHPRVYGEKCIAFCKNWAVLGSPPRMRGKGHDGEQSPHKAWITPAYAGKRTSSEKQVSTRKDHPRICGEKTKKIP